MDAAVHRGVVAGLRRQARFLRVLVVVLGLAVLAQAGTVLAVGQATHRTIIVPPEVNGEFWVEDGAVSRGYFLEWGHYLAGLMLNVTPGSAAYQRDVVLRHVDPASHAAFASRLGAAAARQADERLSTFFSVSDVHVEPDAARVAFVGTLASYVNGRRVAERPAAYMAVFRVRHGRLLLREFVATDPEAAFEPLPS